MNNSISTTICKIYSYNGKSITNASETAAIDSVVRRFRAFSIPIALLSKSAIFIHVTKIASQRRAFHYLQQWRLFNGKHSF